LKRKNLIIYSVIIVLVILLILVARRRYAHERLIYSKSDTVCFEKDILPVFINKCAAAGCHDPQSRSGSYKLVDYNSIMKGIIPFKPEKSIVYKSIIGKGASSMPPGQELTENEKLLITIWIGQGANNTSCPVGSLIPGHTSHRAINN
jgi:hypothetical protein